jgi:hypothetical protein
MPVGTSVGTLAHAVKSAGQRLSQRADQNCHVQPQRPMLDVIVVPTWATFWL